MSVMSEPANPKGDRHKRQPFGLRLPEVMREILEELAKERASNLTQEIIRAIRESLEREGRWRTTPRKPKSRRRDANGSS